MISADDQNPFPCRCPGRIGEKYRNVYNAIAFTDGRSE